jgi:glycosyltransferase involved in cell wall biosynthesis
VKNRHTVTALAARDGAHRGGIASCDNTAVLKVALLTGGSNRQYVLDLAKSLVKRNVVLEVIGSNTNDCPEFRSTHGVTFLNFRGKMGGGASYWVKAARLATYYWRLMVYAAVGSPRVFHIVWNNRVEWLDRTLLMFYYRACGKMVILTAHNVNTAKRDCHDSAWNRATLRIQYRLCSRIFVHTAKMKRELVETFSIEDDRVTVIPFGVNTVIPKTALNREAARMRLGLPDDAKVILFFGNIAPYKGLDVLAAAFAVLKNRDTSYHLVVAGDVKPGCEVHFARVERSLRETNGTILHTGRFIPDTEVEVHFKAADVLVLPYIDIFQSGVLFLAYAFGVAVVATDVGSLRDSIQEGVTGSICRPGDPDDLARVVDNYFSSPMHFEPQARRQAIAQYVEREHSWQSVGEITCRAYHSVLDQRLG